MYIRKAGKNDLSRIAEIFVFNNRINHLPIFKDENYSFGELQVVKLTDGYFSHPEVLENTWVYDDGLVRGFLLVCGDELDKLYVDPFFQNRGIGHALLCFAAETLGIVRLWALEKNVRAISFYRRHGFAPTGNRKFEDDTTEYLIELRR